MFMGATSLHAYARETVECEWELVDNLIGKRLSKSLYFVEGMTMHNLTRISIAIVCALGVTAAIAQTVQPSGQGATQVRPPLQTAQAPAPAPAGGAASGASTATGATGAGGATIAGTLVFVGIGLAAVAGSTSGSGSPAVSHTP